MVMKMKYLFAIDLDGTLLNDNAELNSKTIEYIKSLDKNDYKVIITTGRPLLGMIDFYEKLGLDTYAICNSGTSIIDLKRGNTLVNHPIDKDVYISVFKETKSILDSAIYTIDRKCYMYKKMENAEFIKHITKGAEVIIGELDEICDISPNGGLFMVKKGYEKEFENIISKHKEVKVRCWGNFYGNDYYEIYNSSYNKATSLKDLLRFYNADTSKLVCFGDSINDSEMLSLTKNSVCMINGKDELKKIATYITKYDNNNDGVIEFIKEFIKENRTN